MILTSDPAALRRLVDLNREVERLDLLLLELHDSVYPAVARREALAVRLEREKSEALPADGETEKLAKRLAENPGADIETAAMAALRRSRSATADREDAAAAVTDVVTGAIVNVDAELEEIQARIAELVGERAEAWALFVTEAHAALADEFRRRFAAISNEIIRPLVSLSKEVSATTGQRIVSGPSPKFGMENKLSFEIRPGDGTIAVERFFPPVIAHREELEIIAEFRAALAAGAAVEPA